MKSGSDSDSDSGSGSGSGRELSPEELAEHLQAFDAMENLEFEEVYDERDNI